MENNGDDHNAQGLLEIEELVTRILGTDNPYEILRVPRDAHDNDIRTSHNELVLLLHPDRNRAHFATHPARERDFARAFQKVREAKDLLLNPLRRNAFNGNPNANANAREAHRADSDTESDAEFEPAFGAPNPNANARDENNNWWNTRNGFFCLVFLSVILLLVIPAHVYTTPSVTPPSTGPIFRLVQDRKYRIPKRTVSIKIEYFVTLNFETEFKTFYQGTRAKLEADVKTAYRKVLERKCYREKNKDYYLEMARISGNRAMYLEATTPGTPSCDKIERLFGTS